MSKEPPVVGDMPNVMLSEDNWQNVAKMTSEAVYDFLTEAFDLMEKETGSDDGAPMISGAIDAVVRFAVYGADMTPGLVEHLKVIIDERAAFLMPSEGEA